MNILEQKITMSGIFFKFTGFNKRLKVVEEAICLTVGKSYPF